MDSGATVAAAAAQPTASSTGMIKNHVFLDLENTTFWSHLVTYRQVYIEATSADSSKGTQKQGRGKMQTVRSSNRKISTEL